MQTLHLTWKVLSDFVGSNGLQAFLEGVVLLFFWAAVLGAILSCIRNAPSGALAKTVQSIVTSPNFNYVATVVAGLVLTAATGAIGAKPSQLPVQSGSGSVQAAPAGQTTSAPAGSSKTQPIDSQKQAFQILCGWSYIALGVLCLIVFVIPSPTTHDLVKTVGLTTLGFAGTIIGGLSS
jgi:hypothetical protein